MILLLLISFFSLFKFRKHFIFMLLLIELIFLNIFFMIFLYLFNFSFEYYFMIYFLVLSVCDGVLGLSVLVYCIRKIGCDYILFYDLF
uniref:NADH dehydrogenase subunit 4L n=1 Tax=Metanigrus guttatus TaxID=3038047 RepID=A0AB38XYA5_9HEMI